jgi:hypothetical protein
MEWLRDYTKKVALELDIEFALSYLSKGCFSSSRARRFISGVAVYSRDRDVVYGQSVIAGGIKFSLPTVLLWNHEWTRPLGRVVAIEARGDQVLFKAEIANVMPWVDQIWQEIIARNVVQLSINLDSLLNPVFEDTFAHWHLNELSVVQLGVDHGAVIKRCWERVGVVYLDGRSSETVHWEER